MAATVVVVDVEDVVVEVVVDVELEVDVVAGVVVVVVAFGADVVFVVAANAASLALLSPQAVRASSATDATATHLRRMPQSATEYQRCNAFAAASWPERMQAGMPIP